MPVTMYSVFYVIYYELGHLLFGACVSLLAALLLYSSISITYRYIFSIFTGFPHRLTSSASVRVGFYILLCSLSVAVCSHVLEDRFVDWF